MKDLITIDQISSQEAFKIFEIADSFSKSPPIINDLEPPKTLINFFFENSTRTRTSMELAAKNMGVQVINIDISLSSLKKGESVIDTAKTINAMRPDYVAIRHNSSGIVSLLKKYMPSTRVINAGDGTNEHPTQALLDAYTIRKYKKDFKGLKVAICGDVLHSRVARSNIKLLTKLGCKINVITPPTLVTKDYREWLKENWNINLYLNLEEGIKNVDVVMMLRIQRERMKGCYISSLQEYFKLFGLTKNNIKLAKKDAIVMHPGPINREVEIASNLADDVTQSVILDQVYSGVIIRQAILKYLH